MEWRESSESGFLEYYQKTNHHAPRRTNTITGDLECCRNVGKTVCELWQSIEHLRAIKEGPHDISGEQDECKTVAAQEVWTTPT